MQKLIFIILLFSIYFSGCCTFSGGRYTGNLSDHFDSNQFFNQEKNIEEHGFFDMTWWNLNRDKGAWNEWTEVEYGPKPIESVGKDEMKVTFINHSTILIQVDGVNILTDPIWSDATGPFSLVGVSRKRNPGIRFEDLPKIDIVLISHNHYDHLDIPTLVELDKKFKPIFITTLGNTIILKDNGIGKSCEFDWWQDTTVNNLRITVVPSHHFSMRGLCDGYATLWAGFVIQTTGGPIYFAGDTGFGKHFEQIYKKFGKMRFSMLPIGAFMPRWFMINYHTSPEESVKAHKILHSQLSMGIHYGTFTQADDGQYEPHLYLQSALRNENVSENEFQIFSEGTGYYIPKLK